MTDTRDDVHSRQAALRARYSSQLLEKIRQIERLWSQVLSDQEHDEALVALRQIVHRLAGSGATFGFSGVSDAAQGLSYVFRAIEQNGAITADQRRQVSGLMRSLSLAISLPDQAAPLLAPLAERPIRILSDNRPIYLVADDTDLATDLAFQIGYYGYTAQPLVSPTDLLAATLAMPPAAIIMDTTFISHGSEGANTLTLLQQGRTESIPVLFISTNDDLHDRLRAVRAGGSGYFARPIDIGTLIDHLDAMTSARASDPYRILIVEDSRQLARYYTAVFEQAGMITRTVINPLDLMCPLTEFRPDLILMDVYMPECTGMELARVIRQQEAFLSIPIVFLSAESDLSQQLAAMSLGGDDFLTKPITPSHLVSVVISRAERSRALRSFMTRDSLTGLLNHTATKEQLDRELARAMRAERPLSVAMIDIDRFKRINDTYGHLSGDHVLKSLARLLRQRMRKSDSIGRYGGEEFAVILPDTDGPAALHVLDSIREGFNQFQHQVGRDTFSVSFSCGIAAFPDYSDPSILIDVADRMLYEAKSSGRNRVLLASPRGETRVPVAKPMPRKL